MKIFPTHAHDVSTGGGIDINTPRLDSEGLYLLEARINEFQIPGINSIFGTESLFPLQVGMVCKQNIPTDAVDTEIFGHEIKKDASDEGAMGMGFDSNAWSYPDAEVLAHEIGHAIGRWHVPITTEEADSIPYVSPRDDIEGYRESNRQIEEILDDFYDDVKDPKYALEVDGNKNGTKDHY